MRMDYVITARGNILEINVFIGLGIGMSIVVTDTIPVVSNNPSGVAHMDAKNQNIWKQLRYYMGLDGHIPREQRRPG